MNKLKINVKIHGNDDYFIAILEKVGLDQEVGSVKVYVRKDPLTLDELCRIMKIVQSFQRWLVDMPVFGDPEGE